MYTQQQFDHQTRSKTKFIALGLLGSICSLFVLMGILIWSVESLELLFGSGASIVKMGCMILIVVTGFLLPLLLIEKRAERYQLECPHCGDVLNRSSTLFVNTTKHCRSCSKQVIKSEFVRNPRVYRRWQRRREPKIVFWAVGAFAGAAAVSTIWVLTMNGPPGDEIRIVLVTAAVGLITSVYGGLRTRKLKYLWPFGMSLVPVIAMVAGTLG